MQLLVVVDETKLCCTVAAFAHPLEATVGNVFEHLISFVLRPLLFVHVIYSAFLLAGRPQLELCRTHAFGRKRIEAVAFVNDAVVVAALPVETIFGQYHAVAVEQGHRWLKGIVGDGVLPLTQNTKVDNEQEEQQRMLHKARGLTLRIYNG